MKCERYLGTLLDTAAGLHSPSIDLETHLRTCPRCFATFCDFRKTMDLMDEWKCPEPSQNFDSQLRARLVRVRVARKIPWWSLLPSPVFALGTAMLLFAGALVFRYRTPSVVPQPPAVLEIVPGSAVGDLQVLGEIEDASGGSELLDELAPLANQN